MDSIRADQAQRVPKSGEAARRHARDQGPDRHCRQEHGTGATLPALTCTSILDDPGFDLGIWRRQHGRRSLNSHCNVLL